MTGPELIVTALVYVATLLAGMRGVGGILPQAQEAGFVVGAIAAGVTAALAYQRRAENSAPVSARLVVGLMTAAIGVVVGMICQPLWQPMLRPMVSLPLAAAATVMAPFVIFPLVRRLTGGREVTLERRRPPLGETHVLVALAAAVVLIGVAYAIPVPGRSNVRLVGKYFPSLFVPLPEWAAEQDTARMNFGSIKLKEPESSDRFVALRWTDSDPVQAEDHIQVIAVGGLQVREKRAAFVSKHQGMTFYLESDDRLNRAVATIWNCPQDHRVLWLFSYLSGPKSAMLATHEKILGNTHCHTGRNREVIETIHPAFAAPPGFVKQEGASAGGAVYLGPEGRSIVFDAAVSGTSDLVGENVSPAVVARLFTTAGMLERVEGAPTLVSTPDLQGHTRRVWSAAGTAPSPGRGDVQIEVMVWHCEQRNLTFIGRYADPTRHDPQVGINAMLPAVCHK